MRALLLVAVLGLASCQPAGVATSGSSDAFARELAGRTAGPAQACVSAMSNQHLAVIDSRTVAQRVGRTIWVNRLAADCPALSPFNTLIVETQGGQYCRGDRVRGAEPGAIIAGPACILRDWVPYR